jgi:hypothetical protein
MIFRVACSWQHNGGILAPPMSFHASANRADDADKVYFQLR